MLKQESKIRRSQPVSKHLGMGGIAFVSFMIAVATSGILPVFNNGTAYASVDSRSGISTKSVATITSSPGLLADATSDGAGQLGGAAGQSVGTPAGSVPTSPTLTPKKNDCADGINGGHCGIADLITVIVNVLSALAAVVVVIMIIIGGIQYSISRDDPQAVAAAKQKIMNAVLALFLFIFGVGFLQWISPGGIFK